jgi:hypothetical protein
VSDDQWGAGDPAKWSDHGTVRVRNRDYPLIYGEHPHSRSDNRHYVKLGEGEPTGFSGHRILTDVRLTSSNYLKSSGLSGDDVRAAGSGEILADGVVVFEFFFRDVQWALLRAHHLIGELMEHSSGWMIKSERDRLKGRKIYYREVPAIITGLVVDQGCVMISTESGQPFPPPVYDKDDDEQESTIKDEVLSKHIWWHRE